MACLSLAAKMEEIKVPALSEFQSEECNFKSKVIQRMELLVLNTLEWRMSSITPFAFLHFFITKMCKESPPGHLVSKTVQLILAIMRGTYQTNHVNLNYIEFWTGFRFCSLISCIFMFFSLKIEINLMEHRPSVVAAAATLRALDQRLTRKALECTMNSVSYCGFLEIVSQSLFHFFFSFVIWVSFWYSEESNKLLDTWLTAFELICGLLLLSQEDVFTCYSLMQKLDIPKSVNSPDLSPTRLRAINVLDDSSSSAAVFTKRKRLTFNRSDNSGHDIPNEKRLC